MFAAYSVDTHLNLILNAKIFYFLSSKIKWNAIFCRTAFSGGSQFEYLTSCSSHCVLVYFFMSSTVIYWKKNVDCTNHRGSRFCEEFPSQNMKHHILPFSPDKEPVISEDRLIRQCHSSMSIQVRCTGNEYHGFYRFSKEQK